MSRRLRAQPTEGIDRELLITSVGIACISPLAWNPFGLGQFHSIKLLVTGLAAGLGVVLLLRRDRLLVPRRWWPFVGLAGWLLLSAVVNDDRSATLLGYSDRHAGLLLWVLVGSALLVGVNLNAATLSLVSRAVAVVGGVVGGLTMAQRLGVGPFSDIADTGGRATGTFGSASFTGAFLVMALPFGLVWTASAANARSARLGAISTALSTIGLAVTGSRAAWIAALMTLVVVVFGCRERRRALVAGVGSAVGLASTALLFGDATSRVADAIGDKGGTGAGRTALWSAVWPTVAERPVFGWGPDRTRVGFPLQLPMDFEARFGTATVPDRAHNVIADIAIWAGLPAVVLWTACLGAIGVAAVGAIRAGALYVVPATAAVTGYIAHLLFNFPTIELDVVAALFVGVVLRQSTVEIRLDSNVRRVIPVVTAVPIVLFAIWAGALVFADVSADRAVDRERAGDFTAAESSWERAVALSPTDSQPLEALSRFRLRSGDGVGAIAAADRAFARNPDPFHFELSAAMRVDAVARGLVRDGATLDDGVERYGDLVDDWPHHAPARIGYGVGLALGGDEIGAIEQLEIAIGIDPRLPLAYINLAQVHILRGDVAAASVVIDAGLEAAPSDRDLLDFRAELDRQP